MSFSHQKNGEKIETPLRTQAMLAAGFLQAVVWGDGMGGVMGFHGSWRSISEATPHRIHQNQPNV